MGGSAGYIREISIEDDEFWWGGIIESGIDMPFGKGSRTVIDFTDTDTQNQVAPLMLSSHGRSVHIERPCKVRIADGKMTFSDNVVLEDNGVTLRDAASAAAEKYYLKEEAADSVFFKDPQYNTWIELNYDQNEEAVLKYAHSVIDNGFPHGVLMIDDGWARDYGTWDFRRESFGDPAGMVDELHNLGFKVMLWVAPYISPDSEVFRELEEKGMLLRDADGETAIRKWWNGYSAVLDLTEDRSCGWFEGRLRSLMQRYGIDGFKFDGGDPHMYHDSDRTAGGENAWEQCRAYCRFGEKFRFNEFRCGWDMMGSRLTMRLADKRHSWDDNGLNCLIPDSLLQGLMGYWYSCPDMIGGGEYKSFLNHENMDEELVVRYAQAAALCPMMQFSVSPWRVLSAENVKIIRNAVRLHSDVADEIVRLSVNASEHAEPVMRSLEYEFPGKGYECISDEFMLGDDILSAPVIRKGARKREVVLPEGRWIDDRGNVRDGGQTIVEDAPLDRLLWYRRV